jgi:hypothetical protein
MLQILARLSERWSSVAWLPSGSYPKTGKAARQALQTIIVLCALRRAANLNLRFAE